MMDADSSSPPDVFAEGRNVEVELPSERVIRDDLYFLEFIQLDVADSLLLVPGYHFKHAQFAQGKLENGLKTMELHDVKLEDIHHLLNVMHPLNPEHEDDSIDPWIAVLKLATRFQLYHIRKLAIRRLQTPSIPSTTLVTLARSYGHSNWLTTAYVDLAKRTESITVDEALELGLSATVNICHIRETGLKIIEQRKQEYHRTSASYNRGFGHQPPPPKPPLASYESRLTKIDTAFEVELSASAVVVTDMVERAIKARELGIGPWLRYSYLELANRSDGLSESEAEQLGLEASVRLYRVREEIIKEGFPEETGSQDRVYVTDQDYLKMVQGKFEMELAQVRRDQNINDGSANVLEKEEPQGGNLKKKKKRERKMRERDEGISVRSARGNE